MSAANVLVNTTRKAVVHCLSTNATVGNVTANLAFGPANLIYKAANGSNFQTFDEPNAVASIKGITYSLTDTAHVERWYSDGNRQNVLILGAGSGEFELNGFSYNQKANANIRVTFNGEGFVTLAVHKEAGFVEPSTQGLEQRDRGPF